MRLKIWNLPLSPYLRGGSEIAKKHITIFGCCSQKEASDHKPSRRRHGTARHAVRHALCHASVEKGYGRELYLVLYGKRSGVSEGYSYIWAIYVCAPGQGMVFKIGYHFWVNCKERTTCTNSSEVKPDLCEDQDQQCSIKHNHLAQLAAVCIPWIGCHFSGLSLKKGNSRGLITSAAHPYPKFMGVALILFFSLVLSASPSLFCCVHLEVCFQGFQRKERGSDKKCNVPVA